MGEEHLIQSIVQKVVKWMDLFTTSFLKESLNKVKLNNTVKRHLVIEFSDSIILLLGPCQKTTYIIMYSESSNQIKFYIF